MLWWKETHLHAEDAYNCITQPGRNSPILRGTLYDITLKTRTKVHQVGASSPGPARYNVPTELSKYGLDQKIANVKVPKKSTVFDPEVSQGESCSSQVGEPSAAAEESRLPRIDSSPL
eukprot:g6335.t1